MKNYGILTQICVLQGFNAKEAKLAKMTNAESAECLDNFSIVSTTLEPSGKMNVTTIKTLSRQRLRRMPEKTTERMLQHFTTLSQHNTRLKAVNFFTTFQSFVVTYYKKKAKKVYCDI